MKLTFALLLAFLFVFSAVWIVGCGDDDDDDNNDDTTPGGDDDDAGDDWCPGYSGDNPCCKNSDPCDWGVDGYCDCDDQCSWDREDCGSGDDDDDDDDDDDNNDDCDDDDDDNDDDDNDDDNDDDDDDDDDDTTPPPDVTNEARAAGFKLFYRERSDRLLLAWNRFGMTGDAGFGTTIGKHFIAKAGNDFEVQAGETDNNDIGQPLWSTWQAAQHFAGRNLDLTLMRMFEGMAFYESISGHQGITSREVLPGWTRVMDGVNSTITRTRDGDPISAPSEFLYDPSFEQEILDTFYDDVVVTYRENPGEYYWNFKPRAELGQYAVTWVFSDWPNWLHISNCCGSWMVAKKGMWEGAFWGNHNSRDNFPDMAMGFLSAFEAERDESLPADVRAAAAHAAIAGHRVGDRIIADTTVQMTVDETHDYETLVPGGQVRPDGRTEWQDLGSLASCTTAYLAKALTTEGLSSPVPAIPMPGSIENSAIQELLRLLGFEEIPLPPKVCHNIDDAFFGLTWREFLDAELLGISLWDLAFAIAEVFPDLFPELVGSTGDDFKEMEMAAMALCYYADMNDKTQLLREAKAHLANLLDMHHILAELAYGGFEASLGTPQHAVWAELVDKVTEDQYVAAFTAALYGLDYDLEDFDNFSIGEGRAAYLESILAIGDTNPWPLLTDDEIMGLVQNELDGKTNEPWIVERYWERFPDGPPIRRAGEGYEAINADGQWQAAENPRHASWHAHRLMYEMALCTNAPWVMSCEWAALGCERPDLNDSGGVDASDQSLFDDLMVTYSGVTCDVDNTWCEGADLDRDGEVGNNDLAFMVAAQGCVR